MSVQEMEDFDDLMHRMLDALPPEQVLSHYRPEQVLSHFKPEERIGDLPPEQVLSHYKPEERLAGLDRDHAALALPLEVLRVLPEEYLRSLSPETQAEIRRRLGKNGHAESNGR